MRTPKSKKSRMQSKHSELQEVELLKSWIESQQPERGSNPTSLPALPLDARAGRLDSTRFSRYAGATRFDQLPISKKTKDALRQSKKYVQMSDIQRACLPHALCGRDVRGAAKTGSGKTLAFVIPIVEKLYRERWCPQDGVGSIVISPTREIASQTFDVFVLDEVDSMLSDPSFKQTMNAIISQLPKQRQTLIFSATHPKDVKDLAALCLKDPEFLNVHEKSATATPSNLQQTFVIVPLHKKLDMLWRFIKKNLKSRILVFLSTRKQVQFVYEAFTTLRPGISLMALYGKLDQLKRMATASEFSKQPSVLFSTDVASRGLDFNQGVDWVVQPNKNVVQSVSGKLADSIVQDPDLHGLAQNAFETYLKSVDKKDKEIFDVTKLPIDEFSASIGLASTPRIRFLNNKIKSASKKVSELSPTVEPEHLDKDNELELLRKEELDLGYSSDEEGDKDPLLTNDIAHAADGEGRKIEHIFFHGVNKNYKLNVTWLSKKILSSFSNSGCICRIFQVDGPRAHSNNIDIVPT
ncbi:hypothetical protein DVH24_020164 [Malus domestica]|uniref:ATP-dependent RNA helicase n=1 Tax=Malus domestica TaxID=3750 RepID=A0A498JCP2_MALDO|nr:hypothetical protein DVH24_020164 [Malus domestica]